MPSLSDNLLAGGCALHIENIHGEMVVPLTGPDAGRSFVAVREIESDIVIDDTMTPDPRAKRMLRFRSGSVPRLLDGGMIQTSDGKKWRTTREDQSGYLTEDYQMVEIVAGKDQQ